MNRLTESYTPRARHEDLVMEALGDETLVYDMRNHKAHCLNRTAALIWNRCDGKATISEMILALEKEFDTPVNSNMVWLALEQLNKASLLSDQLPKPPAPEAMTRRAAIRKIGFGAAIALPLVTSILVPNAAASASTGCAAPGQTCNPDAPTPCCNAGSFCLGSPRVCT